MGQADVARKNSEMARRALRLQSFDRRRRRAADCQAGRWTVDRKPEAPETAAKSTIHIKKSEVKPGGCRHRDAVEHDPSFPEHLPRPLAKALTFWSMTVEESQIFWTMSCRGQKGLKRGLFHMKQSRPEHFRAKEYRFASPKAINQGFGISRASFPVWRAVKYK